MSIVGAFVMPHPPIIFPEIGKGEEVKIKKTIDACREVARRIAELKPDTIVLTSPHSVMYEDYIHISPGKEARGDMSRYNAPQISVRAQYDEDFVRNLEVAAKAAGVPAGTRGARENDLDHATVIPLRWFESAFPVFPPTNISNWADASPRSPKKAASGWFFWPAAICPTS